MILLTLTSLSPGSKSGINSARGFRMTLKNLTTGKIICSDLKIAESFIDRILGLLIKSNPRSLLFKTRFGIHTFFLKEPIDVLILNSGYKIVELKPNLKPNRLFFWNPKFKIILELKKGRIKKFRIKEKDILRLANSA